MRFLHVSDLHIGKKLSRLSLMEDQKDILEQIIRMAAEADCVLVAGDVFNRAQPSQDSLQLAGWFLEQLAALHVPTAVIAGNHDNGELIEYCAGILRSGGIYACGTYGGQLEKIMLSDAAGEVDVWLMPFLRPANVRPYHPESQIETYADAIRCVLENAPIDKSRRNVLVAHQYVAGATVCESEELIIGGVDQIPAELFDDFDYVAMGHLHTPQRVGANDVRYSGSPLAYSISEAGGQKCALMVDMDARGDVQVERRPLKPLHPLREVRGKFADVMAQSYSEDYVSIVLTDADRPMDAAGALRVNFPNMIGLLWANREGVVVERVELEAVEKIDPATHIAQFYRQQNGGRDMSGEQMDIVRALFAELSGEGGAR